MQFDTMLAYNELLADKPWTADLAVIAKDHGLSVNLTTRRGAYMTLTATGTPWPREHPHNRNDADGVPAAVGDPEVHMCTVVGHMHTGGQGARQGRQA